MTDLSSSREHRKQQTRAALISAARRLFAEKGYHATGTHELVAAAGVTRGALQHHFPRKEDLFLAVFHAVEQELFQQAAIDNAGLQEKGGIWRRFQEAILAFLSAASTPEVQRILLIDGPAVLGWTEWRRLEAHYGLGSIMKAVEDGIAAGAIRSQRPEPLAHLMLAAIDEAALMIAHAEDKAQASRESILAIETLLGTLA